MTKTKYWATRHALLSPFLLCIAPLLAQELQPIRNLQPAACAALGDNFVFSISSLSCLQCAEGLVASDDGFRCNCPSTSRSEYTVEGDLVCTACAGPDEVVSEDGRSCIPCGRVIVEKPKPEPIPDANPEPVPDQIPETTPPQIPSETTPATTAAPEENVTAPVLERRRSDAASYEADQRRALKPTTYNAATKVCSCPPGHVLSDYNSTGQISMEQGMQCLLCPFNSYVDDKDPYSCVRCPDPLMHRDLLSGKCVCDDGYIEDSEHVADNIQADVRFVGRHVCLDRAKVNDITFTVPQYGKQQYFDVLDAEKSRTDTVTVDRSVPHMHHFLEAAVRCQDSRRIESCHALANLCALNLYDNEAPACVLLERYIKSEVIDDVHGFQGWHQGYPWLQYESPPRNVLLDTRISRPVALSGELSYINLTLSVYALNGSLIGMKPLTTQLLLCKGDDRELQRFKRFGTNSNVECALDLLQLMREFPEPHFYELWVVDGYDQDGNSRDGGAALYPVPVILINYRDTRNNPPNPNNVLVEHEWMELGVGQRGELALDQVVLHRRFFIWDNIGGRKVEDTDTTEQGEDGQPIRTDPVVIRWAKKIQLRISLQPDDTETQVDESLRMFPPQLVIEYEQQMSSTVPKVETEPGSDAEDFRFHKVYFTSHYTRDLTYYWYITMILFIVLCVCIVILFFVKAAVHNQQSSLKPLELGIDLLGVIANFFFVFLLAMSGYWFVFFKMQAAVKVLLPREDPHVAYLSVLIASTICKVFQVMLLVYKQCNVHIFFIDWEKEKEGGGDVEGKEEKPIHPDVSVWRSILIANEWCEMQGERHTDVDFTLMFLLLFLAGLKYENLATAQPDEDFLEPGKPNVLMRFFVISMWYFTVVVMQLGWMTFSYRFQRDPLDQFVDLCQLSNISAWILDRDFHGYYVHGRSVHPHTDVNMHQMQTNLKDESDAKRPNRGLTQKPSQDLNGYTDMVFEVYITDEIRKEYRSQFKKMLPHGGVQKQGDTKTAEAVSRAHFAINEYLMTQVIDDIHNSNVQTPTFVHNVLGTPPCRVPPPDNPVLLRDNRNLYARVLFYGIEGDLIILDLLVFIVWDLIFQDVFIAALLTYVGAHALMELRCKWGTSNVAKKTLVDERFLI
eukprot:CAMPEP_0181293250 /NCGR_PEP_ID=MMETSP1101-20121128/2965_1 /TAXON_ID=46948 /ORGANISM="Rhodomonas abbreviata, Strain Caron Lab Isolate" /LENGTH=1131 /DNA_ID=CAMNT_0023397825 /DNA_START=397 /DNA_END=3793 /DNA_ORIENTATION=-